MCILLSNCTNTVVTRLANKRAQIASSKNNLEPQCKKRKLIHKAGHVSWMKDAACEKQTVVFGHTKM